MNEPILITDMGEKITPDLLENIDKMNDEQLVELTRYSKLATNLLSKPEKELKKRLDARGEVAGMKYKDETRGIIPENDANKKAFMNKYGLDAFQIKTPKQLKDKFGSDIQSDLDKVVVYKHIKKVDWV
ncbi:hypothetical protein LIX87_08575 [Weissella viridescens]|jgi:hypothetical protein|uniref:hypothetical protein n=1 Tax=Weissella viridescens TaxID=1629 RepID=UPI001D072147|nr:hypothetical protein [Weissella viridescens]MCB6841028.1 hypothetical protein [Weissella viridescens]MCB6847763.1 hypothetical protein [Weissella viridescens]